MKLNRTEATYFRALQRLEAQGKPPTIREIAREAGHTSCGNVCEALSSLSISGLTHNNALGSRTWRTTSGFFVDREGTVYRPHILPE